MSSKGISPKRKINGKSKRREQKYRTEWETNTDKFGPSVSLWLHRHNSDPSKAECRWCDLELTANSTNVKDHFNSKRHQIKEKARKQASTKTMQKFLNKSHSHSPLSKSITEAEIKIAAFIATHNLSFKTIDHLLPTLKSCFPDSAVCQGMNLKRKKCTSIVTNVIGATYEKDLANILKETKFSILTDESTDMNSKIICIMVRFYSQLEGRIVSRLFDLKDVFPKGDTSAAVVGATGSRLHELLMTSLKDHGIPLRNVIGFGCDSASTNVGGDNSIISRLRQDCPGIILMKCVCHSIHRASSDACKSLPRACEDLVKNIHSYFKHSAKRKAQLKEFQDFAKVEDHQILGVGITRWLSFFPAVQRILEQWDALLLFFTDTWSGERTLAAEQIYQTLSDPFMKLYYEFLEWILPKVTNMNEHFQSSRVIVTSLHEKMEETYREILNAYMSPEYVAKTKIQDIQPNFEEKYLLLANVYFGVKVNIRLRNPNVMAKPDLIHCFKQRCRDYLIHLCIGIRDRFPFGDKLLVSLQVLHPKKALSLKERENTPSLLVLSDLCPRATTLCKLQDIDDEWRRLPMYQLPEDIAQEQEVDVFWHKLSSFKSSEGVLKYKELPRFALSILTLPHANADCERTFSKLNLTKTKVRNLLGTNSVKGSLLTSQCVKSQSQSCCYGFKPTEKMIKDMTSSVLYPQNEFICQDDDSNSDLEDFNS
ncbi:UNVERIFIED_CONTAM: hypothetical protein RMT77_001057 [Armadillidium vulgare]|nr:Zinc finger protein [Armadillidium vulgare]